MSMARNVAKLTSSTIAAQITSFIATPILARLFIPEQFGNRQIFVSIAGIVSIIACLGYEFSIPLGKDQKEASAGFILSFLFTLAFTLVLSVTIPITKGKMAQSFKEPELERFLGLLPIAVLMSGTRASLRNYAAREQRFGAMAWSDFGAALAVSVIMIGWATTIGATTTGIFAGYFGGLILNVLLLLFFVYRKLVSDIKNAHLDFTTISQVAKHYRKFPVFGAWSALFNTISVQLPSVILGLFFSTTVVGYYSLAQRFVYMPMRLLGNSIGQVFFPTAAQEYNERGTLSGIVSTFFKRLVQIGIFPMMALCLLSAPLFGLIFGEKWIEAGVYAQILSLWMLLVFITSPLITVILVLQRQGTGLAFNVLLMCSRTLALALGTRSGNPRAALAAFAVVSVIGWCTLLCWILRNSQLSLRWGISTILKYVGLSSALLFPPAYFAWCVCQWKSDPDDGRKVYHLPSVKPSRWPKSVPFDLRK